MRAFDIRTCLRIAIMSPENVGNGLSDREGQVNSCDLECIKFTGLYLITTGKIPSRDKITFLRHFIHLSLEQGSGGFDAIADRVASESHEHSQLARVYWQPEQVKKYRNLLTLANNTYTSEEARRVKEAMAAWYNVFHYQESESRQIHTPIPEKENFRSNSTNPIVIYRESTNRAYMNAMLEIIDPATDKVKEAKNEKLLSGVFYPVIMVYQLFSDVAQSGLGCQKSKMTMDKLSDINLNGVNSWEKIKVLTDSAKTQANIYTAQIEFPTHLTNMNIRSKLTQAVAWLGYAQELVKYQVLHSANERYPQVI